MKNEFDIKHFVNKVNLYFANELIKYEIDNDLPYILFGGFALLVSDLIKSKHDSDQLTKAVLLIEEMAASQNPEVKDLFMVGFLEVFSDENSSVEYSRQYLSKSVNDYLDVILNYWSKKK
jgi:hypothetical protein